MRGKRLPGAVLTLVILGSGAASAQSNQAQEQALQTAAENVLRACVAALETRKLAFPAGTLPPDWNGKTCLDPALGLPRSYARAVVSSAVTLQSATEEGYTVTVVDLRGRSLGWPTDPTLKSGAAERLARSLNTGAVGWSGRLLGALAALLLVWALAVWPLPAARPWAAVGLGLGTLELLAGLWIYFGVPQGGSSDVPSLYLSVISLLLGFGLLLSLPRLVGFFRREAWWVSLGLGALITHVVMVALLGLITSLAGLRLPVSRLEFLGQGIGQGIFSTVPAAVLLACLSLAVGRWRSVGQRRRPLG